MSTSGPPIAKKQPKSLETHGDVRVDNYYWLCDRNSPDTLDYLNAENDYAEAQTAHTKDFKKALYDEMLGRIQETDLSVPTKDGDYFYYSRTEEGKAYRILCRKQGSLDAPEEILLDENKLAEGHEFFALGDYEISLNHQLLAYAIDTDGSERCTLIFKDLATGKLFPEEIEDISEVIWANDNRTTFYTRLDEAHRPYQVWKHRLGDDPAQDQLIYEETDEAFYVSLGGTRSDAYLLISINSKVTTEIRILDANNPDGPFEIFCPRQYGVEYSISHHPGNDNDPDRFYIVTNEDAINSKLMVTPVKSFAKENWQTVIPHRTDVQLTGVSVFLDHLVIFERQGGLPTIRLQKLSTGEETALAFPESTYSVWSGAMPEFDNKTLRFTYTSLITPSSVFDYDMDTHERELKKETPVLGGYDRTQYKSEWLMATAADGTQVPISLVYKKDIQPDAQNPLLLYGYGSYGASMSAYFSSSRLSLLDRGVVFAIAHIRGGGEMGRPWYEDGKFLYKKNTFTDFIACSEYLIEHQWTCPDRLAIMGGSAGGLLMGAVLNMRPELFRVAIAAVPFVDVVTTILDPGLPLSVMEWDEWGNPNEKEYYDYMKSYSPYDNVTTQAYPDLLVTGGLNDPRVSYWEPAKWTAKLRDLKTDQNRLLLKTNMDAGHGGASGRYGWLEETAFEYAFMLDSLGLASTAP
ncbi:S9 family peptidase [Leptolyngbya cf. ectocarpi LEGE 11479]|uniref:S9 family peptidase n=1 Tax=Leptolyngbya cf. ectocarpi LEGE 11479 TaxID=1828722 RepID=A0A928ZYL0_LEPEC|nr:S9 family peptidase [Leptolyngbya ectocarpi]MBE9069820.1 S9 family peptidase [Leptolyngbya cf. ectocarpi LEGE 11479]